MRVVALFRVSTEKQASEGASLAAQERAYDELALRNGWETVGRFKGHESATQAAKDRLVLQRVLACVREQSPDAVYVHEQSRLTRGDELEVAMLLRELRERKAKIIVHGVVRDLGSIDERFMVGIQSLVDRAESERIKERLGRGKRERARQGKRASGAAPFGYRNPPRGEANRGTLQVVHEEAVVVKRLFALSSSGQGPRAVADALNEAGLRAPRGGAWGKTSVERVLNNPAYLGMSASNVWVRQPGKARVFKLDLKAEGAQIVEDAHAAIIDRATWGAVQGRAKLPRTKVPRMLSGLLWVSGMAYTGDSSRNGTFYRPGRGTRGHPWLDCKDTDEAVWRAFASLATGEAFVRRIMEQAQSPHERLVLTQEAEYLEGEIAKSSRRLDNLVNMRAEGEIDKATFLAKSEAERMGVEAKAAELSGIRSKLAGADWAVAARVAKAVQLLLAGSQRLTTDQRRQLLRSLVRRVDVTPEPTGALQRRNAGGLLAGSGGPRWRVGRVDLQLALPATEPNGGPYGADEPQAADSPGDMEGYRDWQWATTPSCWARRGPASR